MVSVHTHGAEVCLHLHAENGVYKCVKLSLLSTTSSHIKSLKMWMLLQKIIWPHSAASISSSRSWWVCGVAIRAKGANTLQFSISMFGKMSCNSFPPQVKFVKNQTQQGDQKQPNTQCDEAMCIVFASFLDWTEYLCGVVTSNVDFWW